MQATVSSPDIDLDRTKHYWAEVPEPGTTLWHFVLTVQWVGRITGGRDGRMWLRPDDTRAEVLRELRRGLCKGADREGDDGVVLFFSLEPDALSDSHHKLTTPDLKPEENER